MAIDTARKRASTLWQYFPGATLDRIASLEEYDGITLGLPVETPGVPELRTLTIHRADTHYTIGRPRTTYTTRRSPAEYTTRRR